MGVGHCLIKNLISGWVWITNIYENSKVFVYEYKTSCCDCMIKKTLNLKYSPRVGSCIPLEMGGVLKIRREFARKHLYEIVL